MESKKVLRKAILEILENQLKSNTPPETKQTYERLKGLGYSDKDTKAYIAQCIIVEIFDVVKYQKPFDKERFITNLNKLPEQPFDDDDDDDE